ncbi:MAG: response regulator [Candidatus Sericytochromatia bacterium]|nr:response regulator [Candidatus Sericytochromatia bacterium]
MSKRLRILIADDESIIRLDMKEMLEERGHEVVGEAVDGRVAVELAAKLEPDLIVMDVKMPHMDGLEAVKAINEPGKRRIPVIMVTAYSAPELVEQAVELGVFAYLVKPIKEADIMPTIEVAMSRAEEMQALSDEIANLKDVLETRKLVEKAKGILIDTYGITEAEAFRRIQKLSMNSRKPLREIADAIILAREVNNPELSNKGR